MNIFILLANYTQIIEGVALPGIQIKSSSGNNMNNHEIYVAKRGDKNSRVFCFFLFVGKQHGDNFYCAVFAFLFLVFLGFT